VGVGVAVGVLVGVGVAVGAAVGDGVGVLVGLGDGDAVGGRIDGLGVISRPFGALHAVRITATARIRTINPNFMICFASSTRVTSAILLPQDAADMANYVIFQAIIA
jgi:glycerol uptake facilitator-like aquaporin